MTYKMQRPWLAALLVAASCGGDDAFEAAMLANWEQVDSQIEVCAVMRTAPAEVILRDILDGDSDDMITFDPDGPGRQSFEDTPERRARLAEFYRDVCALD